MKLRRIKARQAREQSILTFVESLSLDVAQLLAYSTVRSCLYQPPSPVFAVSQSEGGGLQPNRATKNEVVALSRDVTSLPASRGELPRTKIMKSFCELRALEYVRTTRNETPRTRGENKGPSLAHHHRPSPL